MLKEIQRRAQKQLDADFWQSEDPDPTVALSILSRSPFKIYLGGSRRMAEITRETTVLIDDIPAEEHAVVVTDNTDYDFYATYTDELADYLYKNGFHHTDFSSKINEVGYDLDTEAVEIRQRDNVQIVLRKDAEFYRKVFEAIPLEFYHKFLWKSSPASPDRSQIQPIFNALFAVAHATECQNAK